METPLTKAVEIHKALGHPVRLRILAMLSAGELCVCQINAVIRLAPSTVSAHLLDLRRAGLVVERKEGRFISYRHADEPEPRQVLAHALKRIVRDPQLEADTRLIRGVRRVPLENLCRAGLDLERVGLGKLAARGGRL
jgi:DNA-binding transcriptional ArsR family regulator